MAFNINQRLNGLEPLAYAGVNAIQPPDFVTKPRDPTATDSKNFYLGTIWLNTTSETVWMLVSLVGNVATWVMITGAAGAILTLTGNSGGAVSPLLGNINVVGDGTTINVVGNPGTHTLTISTVGTGVVNSLTGNSGGAVFPTAGNTNIVGAGVITVVGNPGTSTLTVTPSGAIASSFPTDSGTATPSSGVLNIKAGVATLNSGSTVEFTGSSNNVTLNVTDASNNTIVGNNAGNATLTSTNTTALGKSAGHALTSSANNTLIGYQSGQSITSGSGSNTLLGSNAGASITTGNTNICIGSSSGSNLTGSESGNILINDPGVAGLNNLFAINIPSGGAGLVGFTMHNYPGGSSVNGANIFAGTDSGNRTMTGIGNCGYGETTLHAVTSGHGNVAVGNFTGAFITTGFGNTALGNAAMTDTSSLGITTGSQNIAVGFTAGSAWITGSESNNICIGDNGVNGESAVTRLGAFAMGTTPQTKCFIQGIRGITTVAADAIAVLISSTGQLGTVSSSRTKKDNIVDMGSYSDVIRSLRPVVFNYKEHSPEAKSVGLIAEEVADVAPQLVVYKDGEPETVKYHDLVPMLLNEFQKHCELIAALQAMNCSLLDRIRVLEEQNMRCH